MRNFYVFVLMLLIGAWANVTQVAAQEATSAVTKALRVTALDQLATGSKIVIRNAGASTERNGYVHESDGKLLINHSASSFQNLTDDYVFTLEDYSATDGTCYLTAKSGNKVSGTGAPMTTVAQPEGKITLVVEVVEDEPTHRWDLKYGNGNWFNTQTNTTDGPHVNTWTSQGDPNATWEIYMVVDDATFISEEGQAYYIDCLKSDKGRAVYLPDMGILGVSGDNEALHLGNLFTISTVLSSGEVRYRIKSYANSDAYVYYVNTNDASANVGITTNASHTNLNWKITKSTATGVDGFNIIPSTGNFGWNCRGTVSSFWGNKTAIGQWSSNATPDNTWGFVAVGETEVAAAVETYKTTIQPTCGTVGCCTQEEYTAALNQLTELKDIFMTPWNIPSQLTLVKPTSASGLYKIKNKALSKYLFQETDDKNIAFINDGGDDSKYYYRVTFDGNQATIVNYNGKPLTRGSNTTYANAMPQVVSPVSLTYCGGNGYFLFPNTHSTAQNIYTKNGTNYNTENNPYFLINWSSKESGNQYTFEEVTIPNDSYVYKVDFEGLCGVSGDDALTVTYNKDGYTGNKEVPNGGFYIFSDTPVASDFKVSESKYAASSVTVDEANHVVKVTFTGEAVNVTSKIKMNGVEYASQTVRVLPKFKSKDLLGDYSGFANCDVVTMQVNEGDAVPVKSCFDENGTNTLASVNDGDTYTFALKTTDLLNGVQPSDMTSVEGMEKGTLYQISSAITKVLSGGRGGKKIYGKPEMIYTKAVGDNLETEPFLAMAHSLWMFVYTDTEQGYFKIYNQVTGKYMGPVVNERTNVAFTDEAGAGVYKLIPTTAIHHTNQTTDEMRENMSNQPLFKIAASDATVNLDDLKKLHIQNTGSNQLIGYDADEIWSKWFFTASHATIAKVEFVKDIDQRLLVQGRVTPSKKADMTDMVITKEDGTDVTTVLTDDNAATSASANVNSYLQVDLGSTSVSAFAFYTKRTPNSNNRPTEIEVQASADGTNFTRLYTFYGIPVANEDFYSPSYPLEGQRYLRFVVKATYSANSTFDFSEFHIQTTKGVLPDALAAASLAAGKAAIDAVCSPYNTTDGYYQGASEDLRAARDNALDYAAAHKALKDRIADLTPFIDRTDLVEGDEVHQFTVARTATAAENWKDKLNEINTYVDDVNNENINTKVGCETVLATLPAITFNTPKHGQIYRLKSLQLNATHGTYATAGQAVLSASPATGPAVENEKAIMLQYTEDERLVSPITGAELTVNGLNHFNFSEHKSVKGTYRVETYYPEGTSGNNARILYANTVDGEVNGNGKIDYSAIGSEHETYTNTSWYLEPVKSYSVKMNPVGNHHWATFYSDKKVFLPEGVKARYVKGNEDGNWAETADGSKVYKLVYTTIGEGDVLPAETGVWLDKRTADGNDATGAETVVLYESTFNNAAAVESNWFVGSEAGNDAYTANGVLYALGKPGDNPAGFYRFSAQQGGTYKLSANKAYLEVPSSVAASLNAFGFVLVEDEGEVTGVQDVPVAEDAVEDDGVYYDLTGKRVVNPTQRGIYIKNGKKLVIK